MTPVEARVQEIRKGIHFAELLISAERDRDAAMELLKKCVLYIPKAAMDVHPPTADLVAEARALLAAQEVK